MSGIQLSGLASGFDWQSFIDQVMELERAPITRFENEQYQNERQINALSTLKDKIVNFRAANDALGNAELFSARTAESTLNAWTVRADPDTAAGEYTVKVTQLATAARLDGAVDQGAGISSTSDVSGVLVSDLPTRLAVSAGTFTVNGAQVDVALTDTLQAVFDKISTATGGDVTASYDPVTDSISLSGSGEIILGAANDTSNFTYALGLFNNGTNTVTSGDGLGVMDIYSNLVDARLKTAITAVDGTGAGTFSINGVSFDYNVNDDSVNDLIARINASTAGVRASYDSSNDRLVLTNAKTGDSGIAVNEAAGGVLAALGLTSGAGSTLARGTNAKFTLNNGPTLTSPTNALDSDVHGIPGLVVTATSIDETTVTVANDTSGLQKAVDTFISKYNDIQDYIEEQTKITTGDDKVTTSTLSGNREVDAWAKSLRQKAFGALADGVSTFSRLESLGIDFISGSNKLEIKDAGKLTDAINNEPDELRRFFATSSTGFSARMDDFVDQLIGITDSGGYLSQETTALNDANKSLDRSIEQMERQLEQRRTLLESGFIAMENAQQKIQTMQSQLENAFPSSSSSSSSSKSS